MRAKMLGWGLMGISAMGWAQSAPLDPRVHALQTQGEALLRASAPAKPLRPVSYARFKQAMDGWSNAMTRDVHASMTPERRAQVQSAHQRLRQQSIATLPHP